MRLGEIALGVLHEDRLGVLITEAIGLAVDRRVDGAIVLTSLPSARPMVQRLSYSQVTAQAALARASSMAPGMADLRMVLVINVSLGIVGSTQRFLAWPL